MLWISSINYLLVLKEFYSLKISIFTKIITKNKEKFELK